MAEPAKPQSQGMDKAKMKQYLGPALAVAAVLVLAGLVIYVSGSTRKMSDGSNGSADDPDLKELTAGVKYRDIKEGMGEPCAAGAEVKVNYTGWTNDGNVFKSTTEGKKAPAPETVTLKRGMNSWPEGIPGMKPGGVRKLVISPEKGFGNHAKGSNADNGPLIFEVQLLEVTPPPKLADGTDPNAPDPGLKDIGEGLKIRDIKEGSGEPVKEGARITIHYTGWLTDGAVFDSSRKRGEPATFELGGLIKGWQKGIPGMKPGGIRKLVVPPELGYGARAQGDIPPNSTLVFEVELIK